jgi:hypothetical protein
VPIDRQSGSSAYTRRHRCSPTCGHARVGDGVREREEELHVALNALPAGAVAVAVGNELREQVPVSRWELRVWTVRPVLGDDLLLVGELSAQVN